MKIWCKWIILVLSLVGMSVWANSSSANSWLSLDRGLSAVEIQPSGNILSLTEVIKEKSGESNKNSQESNYSDNESDGQLITSPDLQEFSKDNPPQVPLRASAILFRDNLQTKPIYWLRADLIPVVKESRSYAERRLPKTLSPWFMLLSHKSSSRLSGWKDGNSLYAATITYH